jgi:hypothetical protein
MQKLGENRDIVKHNLELWSVVLSFLRKEKGVRQNSLTPRNHVEAATGFEPVNNGFADRRLTTWPRRLWSGKRDLNPRLRPWQGRTLPLSYSRSTHTGARTQETASCCPDPLS